MVILILGTYIARPQYYSMAAIPLAFGLLCFLQVCVLGQETEASWHWIMADSRNGSLVCPARCLAVNDSAYPGDYEDKEVGFGPCRSSDSSSESISSTNNNQQWLYDGPGSPTRIRINASEADPPVVLCLQPRRAPGSSQIGLTVARCGAESNKNQSWAVANDSIASLGFDPPLRLSMEYNVSGDGTWRRGSLVPRTDAGLRSKSRTDVFSLVAYTDDVSSFPPRNVSDASSDSANFIQNGGFEQSSFDFPYNVTDVEIAENELFGVCHWVAERSEITLVDSTRMPAAEGNRSVLLKDGRFTQRARTRRGAMYTLDFQIAVAKPDPLSSSGDACNGTETISVNTFPSTNVKVSLSSRSGGAWERKHFGFQAVGEELLVSLTGCSDCGCYVDDVYLMQTSGPQPLPSPPPFAPIPPPPPPEPVGPPGWLLRPPRENASTEPEPPAQRNVSDARPPFEFPPGHPSSRLSNGAVAALLVGSSVLFFLMGATCFGVLGLAKHTKPLGEVEMVRPPEWSIQTTTPPRSEALGAAQRSGSNAPANLPLRPDPSPPFSRDSVHSASSRP